MTIKKKTTIEDKKKVSFFAYNGSHCVIKAILNNLVFGGGGVMQEEKARD